MFELKILILSDLHSNREALETILSNEANSQVVCCVGDFVDYGIAPNEVIATVQSLKQDKYLVYGNHDTLLLDFVHSMKKLPENPREFKWLHDNVRKIERANVRFLEQLPEVSWFSCDGWVYLLKHQYDAGYGYVHGAEDFDLFWQAHMPELYWQAPKRRIVFGHTHRQEYRIFYGDRECINPGSISYRRPDEQDKSAHYCVIEDSMVAMKRLPYVRESLFQAAQDYKNQQAMMETEIQDFYFFFGDAATTREPLG